MSTSRSHPSWRHPPVYKPNKLVTGPVKYGASKMDLEEQKKERKHIESCKRFYSISNAQDGFTLTSESYDGTMTQLFNYTTDKTDVFHSITMNRKYLPTNVNILAKRDFQANLNSAKNQYFREKIGIMPNHNQQRVGLAGGASHFNPNLICPKSPGSFEEVAHNQFNNVSKIIKDKKRSNFAREIKLNKATQPGAQPHQSSSYGFVSQDNKSGSSIFQNNNNPSAYKSQSTGIFNRDKPFTSMSSMSDDNPFKKRDNPASLFKTESKLFPSSGTQNNNSFLFPQRKEATNSIFQKTGSTYGVESPKKFSSGLFTPKDNNPFNKDNSGTGSSIFQSKEKSAYSTGTSTWGKQTTTPSSIFQSKTGGMSSPSKPTSTIFQSKTSLGFTNPMHKKEESGNPFLTASTTPSYSRTYSLQQGPSEGDKIADQKQRDAFQLMTSLFKNPFEREKNKEMLNQFKQSYEKSQAVKMKEIEHFLKNPYQLPKHSLVMSSHRTATAPAEVHRSFPTSYMTSDTGYKRKRKDYYTRQQTDSRDKEEMDKLEYNFSTLLQDLEEYKREPQESSNSTTPVPCNSIGEHKLPKSEKYQTMPSHQEMQLMSESELQRVQNFYVISPFGNVHFLEPVDVRGLQLDRIITFEWDNFQIYADIEPPIRGEGLNVSFDLTVLLSPEAQELKREEVLEWAQSMAYENDVRESLMISLK